MDMDSTRHVPSRSHALRRRDRAAWRVDRSCGAVLAGVLLAVSGSGEATGQPAGLFRAAEPTGAAAVRGFQAVADGLTLRRRLVSIDFGQLTPPEDAALSGTADAAVALSGVLRLNLFDDASFTGLVERVAPTYSGGYSLSGPLAGVEMGTVTLVVNGAVVAGTVRTPEATYRIRPAGDGLHAVSQIDPARLPPLGEPIRRRRADDDFPPSEPERRAPPRPR